DRGEVGDVADDVGDLLEPAGRQQEREPPGIARDVERDHLLPVLEKLVYRPRADAAVRSSDEKTTIGHAGESSSLEYSVGWSTRLAKACAPWARGASDSQPRWRSPRARISTARAKSTRE